MAEETSLISGVAQGYLHLPWLIGRKRNGERLFIWKKQESVLSISISSWIDCHFSSA